jgi:hypothetical protein
MKNHHEIYLSDFDNRKEQITLELIPASTEQGFLDDRCLKDEKYQVIHRCMHVLTHAIYFLSFANLGIKVGTIRSMFQASLPALHYPMMRNYKALQALKEAVAVN